MKFYHFILPAIALALVGSCSKPEPEASFSIASDTLIVGDNVTFKNTSKNADSYYWDFGDGYISYEESPEHTYDAEGIYEVTLTAYSDKKKKKSEKSRQILVYEQKSTDLKLTILLYGYNTMLSQIYVELYGTENDYINQYNMERFAISNGHGEVYYKDLDTKAYYVRAWQDIGWGYYTNEFLAHITPVLKANTVNAFYCYVDFYYSKKKSAKTATDRKMQTHLHSLEQMND